MNGRLPEIGTQVTLRAEGCAFPSVVQDVAGEELALLAPGGPAPELAPDAPVEVEFHDPGGLYRLFGRVARRQPGPVPLLWLRGPWRMERVQRREHVRLDLALPVVVRRGEESIPGRTLDLSGGGLRAVFAAPLSLGETVEVELHLPDTLVRVEGRVLREAGSHEGQPAFALCFTAISEPDREAVYRVIFREIRERRRRGLAAR